MLLTKRKIIMLNICTEDQIRAIAAESAERAVQNFVIKFMPSFIMPDPVPPAAAPKEENLTPRQLANYWQCHIETIRQKKRKGELPFYQIGRKIFFKKSEIDALTANPLPKKRGY